MKLKHDKPLSSFAFKFNLRLCNEDLNPDITLVDDADTVGRCRLIVSILDLEACLFQRLKLKCANPLLNVAFNLNVRRYNTWAVTRVERTYEIEAEVGRCRLTISKSVFKLSVGSGRTNQHCAFRTSHRSTHRQSDRVEILE